MNEPWVNVATATRTIDGIPYRSVVATDRNGFRRMKAGAALPALEPVTNYAPLSTARRTIILVEDSDEDALLFEFAVSRSGRSVNVIRAANLAEARELLSCTDPSLIALDCHLNGESGLDLLQELRGKLAYQKIPIVMLSGTESEADVSAAYAWGANSFLRKAFAWDLYFASVKILLEYWLEQNCTTLSTWNHAGGVYLG